MKKNIVFLSIFLFIFQFQLYGQEIDRKTEKDEEEILIKLPVNLYDSLTFSDEYSPYIRGGLIFITPLFFTVYGITTWGWDIDKGFTYNPETYKGKNAVHGAADKFGHLYSSFLLKRFSTFLLHSSGSSKNRANIEGAILAELIMLATEIADGFSPDYGFDIYDFMFNNIGILIGMIFDWSPLLDRIFTLQFEYVPTKEMREEFDLIDNHDLPTDYGGTKFMLTTKLAGIPYISLSPFRYINIDFGYYSRGYDQKYVKTKTRNLFFGISVNFSIVFGDILPVGYTSSTLQTFFNYIHLPWDIEAKRIKLSKIANENYED
ncbi:MAG: DUF2279 domain-containing protein [Spirochaetota bacterium]|nr:DUF2279 domain-containing protein [Spirochaetota bacterium]